MSREIKFRAWDKDSKRYGEVVEIEYNESREIDGIWVWYNIHERYEPIPGANVTVEQYTGLKDKNGKEIYEGDIIREKWYDNDVNRGRDRIGKIEYFCDRFVCWFGGTFVNLGMFPSENIEVVGNIHENPELLGGEE